VESRQGAFWLRAATGERVLVEAAEAEAEVVTSLAARGVRVAAARGFEGRFARVCTVFGEPSTTLLFFEAEGVHVTAPGAAHAEALGRLIARVHAEAPPENCLTRARRIDRA